MPVPALSDLRKAKSVPGLRLEKGVYSSRSICSESWEQNCDRYRTCRLYFSNCFKVRPIKSVENACGCYQVILHPNGHTQPLR